MRRWIESFPIQPGSNSRSTSTLSAERVNRMIEMRKKVLTAPDAVRRDGLKASMMRRIGERSAILCVMGLGYVGLPLALQFCEAGFLVVGYDVNAQHVNALRRGHSTVSDVSSDRLTRAVSSGRLVMTHSPEAITEAEIYLICVPTPLAKTRQPDLSYIQAALRLLESIWKPGKMVILESTTYPGTTEEMIAPALSKGGLKIDEDYFVAFSPERVDPGNTEYPLADVPKVVGGVTPDSLLVALEVYSAVFRKVHPVSSAKVAELTKLLENTFRNINIAFVNEFAQICHALGIDVWEVIEAAKTKPFGFMAFYPGAGIGGHCIPLDPQYLVYRTRLAGYEPRLVALADQINQGMPRYVCGRAAEVLNSFQKPVKGSRIHVVGVSYKPNIPDTRESPALLIIDFLLRWGARVSYSDPYVPSVILRGTQMESIDLSDSVLESSDLVIIVTPHRAFDFDLLRRYRTKTLDTCNGLKDKEREPRAKGGNGGCMFDCVAKGRDRQ